MLPGLQARWRERFRESGSTLWIIQNTPLIIMGFGFYAWGKGLPPTQAAWSFLVAAPLAAWYAWQNRKKGNIIQGIPTSKIRSAAQGYTELVGETLLLAGQHASVDPYFNYQCLWYRYEEYSGHGKNRRRVKLVESVMEFGLEDSTGVCRIDPRSATILVNAPDTSADGNRVLYSITVGQRLYVLGHFETPSESSRQSIATLEAHKTLAEIKADPHRLLAAADTNQDGDVSLDEWQGLKRRIFTEALQRSALHPASRYSVVETTADSDRPFIITTSDPTTLANRYLRMGWFQFAVAVIGLALFWFFRFNF